MRMLGVAAMASFVVAMAAGPTSVTITSPTNGSTITGQVNLTASVTSFLPIQRVEYYMDYGTPTQQLIATWSNTLPAPLNFRIQ